MGFRLTTERITLPVSQMGDFGMVVTYIGTEHSLSNSEDKLPETMSVPLRWANEIPHMMEACAALRAQHDKELAEWSAVPEEDRDQEDFYSPLDAFWEDESAPNGVEDSESLQRLLAFVIDWNDCWEKADEALDLYEDVSVDGETGVTESFEIPEPSDTQKAMTIGELVDKLRQFDQGMPVLPDDETYFYLGFLPGTGLLISTEEF